MMKLNVEFWFNEISGEAVLIEWPVHRSLRQAQKTSMKKLVLRLEAFRLAWTLIDEWVEES